MTQTTQSASSLASAWLRTRALSAKHQAPITFWLLMLSLGAATWTAAAWAAANLLEKKGPEKLLQLDLHFPKLNIMHTSEPRPSTTAQPATGFHLPALFGHSQVKVVETPAHRDSAKPNAEPWNDPFARTAAEEAETCAEPVIYLVPCNLQRGDSPMTRTWKTVTMYSLLAGAVTFAPPPLLAQGQKGLESKDEPLEKLQKSVDKLILRLEALEKKPGADKETITEIFRAELKKLEEGALGDLSKTIKTIKSDVSNLQLQQVKQKAQIDELADQIENLRKKMLAVEKSGPASPAVDDTFMKELRELRSAIKGLQDTVAKLGPTENRVSAYPNGAAASGKLAKVVLVNFYSDEMLFIINGNPYAVPPRSTKVVENVPLGTMRYEVAADRWGVLENRTTTLGAGDVFTLTATNPR